MVGRAQLLGPARLFRAALWLLGSSKWHAHASWVPMNCVFARPEAAHSSSSSMHLRVLLRAGPRLLYIAARTNCCLTSSWERNEKRTRARVASRNVEGPFGRAVLLTGRSGIVGCRAAAPMCRHKMPELCAPKKAANCRVVAALAPQRLCANRASHQRPPIERRSIPPLTRFQAARPGVQNAPSSLAPALGAPAGAHCRPKPTIRHSSSPPWSGNPPRRPERPATTEARRGDDACAVLRTGRQGVQLKGWRATKQRAIRKRYALGNLPHSSSLEASSFVPCKPVPLCLKRSAVKHKP